MDLYTSYVGAGLFKLQNTSYTLIYSSEDIKLILTKKYSKMFNIIDEHL